MNIENGKLQKFINAVNDQIDEKVTAMLDEAEAEKEKILSAARAQSKDTAEHHISVVSKKTGNKYVRDISRAELDMKKEILRHREELSDKVFEAVKKRICEYRTTSAYFDGLVKTLIMINVSDGSEIRLAPEDMKFVPDLKKALKQQGISFVPDETIRLGGLSVYSESKGTITDKTFDLAVEEQRNAFIASNVYA